MSLWKIIQGEQPGLITSILNYENRGQFGEFATEFALTNHNLEGELVVLKNVYVPFKQNETHRKALAEYLNVPLPALKSYIVFSERCSLKNVPGDTGAFWDAAHTQNVILHDKSKSKMKIYKK